MGRPYVISFIIEIVECGNLYSAEQLMVLSVFPSLSNSIRS
uniref:Uncharacterized protein n=1 Tax=Rhizophora mucronata TaxID=61149 RepID=A0A2P2PSU4_RHIMU